MNIIARIAALLAVRTDIGANVLLVGRLVVRKAQVAINAIGVVMMKNKVIYKLSNQEPCTFTEMLHSLTYS